MGVQMHPARAVALAAGAKTYSTGEPCARGHTSDRAAINTGCLACARERAKAQTDAQRATKRAYDKTPEAKAAKAARRARTDQKAVTKAYNDSWYAQNGKWWAQTESFKATQRRYAESDLGRETLRRLARAWAKTPQGRARHRQGVNTRRARLLSQTCVCCVPADIAYIYDFACWLGSEVDHIKPLALGGAHCKHNLQVLTVTQHKAKTKLDKKLIAEARRRDRRTES